MDQLLMFLLFCIPIVFLMGVVFLFNPKTKKAGLIIVISFVSLAVFGFCLCFG